MLRYKIKLLFKNIISLQFLSFFPNLLKYIKGLFFYIKFNSSKHKLEFKDLYPCLTDNTKTTGFDAHYLYHPAWAARLISKTKIEQHYDFSSILHFGTILSAFVPVKFFDFRPDKIKLSNYSSEAADLCKLLIPDDSLESVSCMHTIEHIGLGRYGDPLDINGDQKAIQELIRVTKPGGHLYFVTPIGKKNVIWFNAHRIYTYELIMSYFQHFELINFSLVTDRGDFVDNASEILANDQKYGCGCFYFRKKVLRIN